MSETKKDIKFEKAIKRLEEIVELLEKGECPLDESVKLFEEGSELSKQCAEQLKNAEQKITSLTKAENGEA